MFNNVTTSKNKEISSNLANVFHLMESKTKKQKKNVEMKQIFVALFV